jgi:hypothetical protein
MIELYIETKSCERPVGYKTNSFKNTKHSIFHLKHMNRFNFYNQRDSAL